MPIRVLVVDDSVLFRLQLQNGLNADPDISVVGCAVDAMDAMKHIQPGPPDVIVLDVEMPKLNGIDFLKQLLPEYPIPVVVITALPLNTFDALNAGAVDFVRKPAAGKPDALKEFMQSLKEKVKVAATAKVRKPTRASHNSLTARLSADTTYVPEAVIAIGASTGGTEAIIEVIKDLPPTTPGIVIVQHMPIHFTKMYADRLDKLCQMKVKEAQDLDRLEPGQILLGAGESHLTLKRDAKGYYVGSRPGPKVNGHCPSVDVLFDSVAKLAGKTATGILLTGMGNDGAVGLLHMRKMGAYTIGQDKESCVVYGMPMEAHKIGAVTRQLPLDQISDELLYHLGRTLRSK